VTASAYLLLGRKLRQKLSIVAYIWPVYSVAAILLLAIVLASGERLTGYAPLTYLIFLLLALGPQLVGHTSLNYALGRLSAVFVTVVILAEPIGSALLALILFREVPPPLALFGAGLILAGIVLTAGGEAAGTSNHSP
jgi:drug/metabolite transporter (DMT)-like permease